MDDNRQTREFRAAARKLGLVLALCATTYVLLAAAALACLGSSIWGAWTILRTAHFSANTIIFAGGIVVVGGLVAFFVLRALFIRGKFDPSRYLELAEDDAPEFHAMVRELASAAGARAPAKVLLSPELNAALVTDAPFPRSLFTRERYLVIGLGLVAAFDIGGLKAVIAHEFGHFGQSGRRTAVASIPAITVVHELAYGGGEIDAELAGWLSSRGRLWFFFKVAQIAIKLVRKLMATEVSLATAARATLGREMEHFADRVSAEVAGKSNALGVLRRMDACAELHAVLLGLHATWFSSGSRPIDLFESYDELARAAAADPSLLDAVKRSLGMDETRGKELVFENPWESHPSSAKRVAWLESLALREGEADPRDSWSLFARPEALRRAMTEKLFPRDSYQGNSRTLPPGEFASRVAALGERWKLPAAYAGCYDTRRILPFDPTAADLPAPAADPLSLFDAEHREKAFRLATIENDLALLAAIRADRKLARISLYRGKRLDRRAIDAIGAELGKEGASIVAEIAAIDARAYRSFCARAEDAGRLRGAYETYFDGCVADDELMREARAFGAVVVAAREGQPRSRANAKRAVLLAHHQGGLIGRMKCLLENPSVAELIGKDAVAEVERFALKERSYWDGEQGMKRNELLVLERALGAYEYALRARSFMARKKLLEGQLDASSY